MKNLLLLAVIVAVVLLGYRWYNYVPPPEKRLAPVGVFYLTRYVSAPTPTGVLGLAPGEEVRLAPGPQPPGRRRITDSAHHIFEVEPSFLTDDLDIAEGLRSSDADRQKQAAAQVLADKANVEKLELKRKADLARKAAEDLAARRAAQAR